jgi:nucleoside-diphosphate-sugar epimerase
LLHAAWITTPGIYWESPENHQWVAWSCSFIRWLRVQGPIHVVALGTCAEYQLGREPMSETQTPLAPTTTYGRCKDALRQWLEAEADPAGDGHCWARVFYPYGPGEDPARLCSVAIRRLRLGQPVENRAPSRMSDYIFVEDLAAALLLLAERRHRGAVNLGTGHGVSIEQIVRTVAAGLGMSALIDVPAAARSLPLECAVADAAQLRGLGWQPRFDLEAGIKRMILSIPPP